MISMLSGTDAKALFPEFPPERQIDPMEPHNYPKDLEEYVLEDVQEDTPADTPPSKIHPLISLIKFIPLVLFVMLKKEVI